MNDKQIQDIADRVIKALEQLKPGDPSPWADLAALTPLAALLAAVVAAIVGWRNLKQQQKALKVSVRSDARNLRQKRLADARTEWWKRAQWALEAEANEESDKLSAAGTEMLKLLVKSDMASDADKDLLDTAWRAGTAAASEETAEEFLAEVEEFEELEADLDDPLETSENEETKGVDDLG